ncbi:Eukaryotic aspartyl protease family protein [Zea mays]|uniref:Eukaryotic aspartyl protease family protein n=1 Tax=Zea mays TaxID=4577 RepID=A0A1D6MC40_MAIZE|nr:Eukaryotic aspartyl protease family protein [Zea mays]
MALRGNLPVLLLLFAAAATASGKSARLDLFPAAPGPQERRRDPRLRHDPHGPRHPGVQGRGRRADQAPGRGPQSGLPPVRALLQLDGTATGSAGDPKAGGAVHRVRAAGATGEELRDRRETWREVHRLAGGRVARRVGHRQHHAARAPLGIRPQEHGGQVHAVDLHPVIVKLTSMVLLIRAFEGKCFF